MKKKLLIALAMCMALGTACGKETAEEEKTARSVEVMTAGEGTWFTVRTLGKGILSGRHFAGASAVSLFEDAVDVS